jgi:hypothetical protein
MSRLFLSRNIAGAWTRQVPAHFLPSGVVVAPAPAPAQAPAQAEAELGGETTTGNCPSRELRAEVGADQ